MKRKLMTLLTMAVMVTLLLQLGFAVTYRKATVVEVTGAVSVLRAGGERAITPTVNMTLEHGDRIITGKGASIALKIDEDKYIKVGEKTYMSLSELMEDAENGTSTNIKLFTGQVWASLTRPLGSTESFQIETPTAVMGAKGTKFVVKYTIEPNEEDENYTGTTDLIVLEGTVSMRMGLEPPSGGNQGGQGTGQDVELYVHQNQQIKVDAKLLKSIADEINKQLSSGTKIQDIVMSDIVSKVAEVQNVTIKNLDLFVLEIIEEDPEDYDPDFLEGLDDAIRDQQSQQGEDDDGISDVSIIYNSGGGTTGGTTGGGSSDGTSSTSLTLNAVKTIDADEDGYIDYLKLTFNLPVSDDSFNDDVSLYLSEHTQLGNLYHAVADMSSTDILDDVDDNVIYLEFTTQAELKNTGVTGTLTVSDSGLITSTTGKVLSAVSKTITDGAAPVLKTQYIDLYGDALDKGIVFEFSEPVVVDGAALIDGIAVSLDSQSDFAGAQALLGGFEEVWTDCDSLFIVGITGDALTVIADSNDVYFFFDSGVSVEDAAGNTCELSGMLTSTGSTKDDLAATLTVDSVTMGADTDSWTISLESTDYLSGMSLLSYFMSSPLYTSNGDLSPSFTGYNYNPDDPSMITLDFDVSLSSLSLSAGDVLGIQLSGLGDDAGYQPVYAFDDVYDGTIYFEYDGTTFVEIANPSLVIKSVETIDGDLNGYVDTLKITFNMAVDDNEYNSSAGVSLSNNMLGALNDAELAAVDFSAFGSNGEVDVANDEVIYLALEEYAEPNTGETGMLTLGSDLICELGNTDNPNNETTLTLIDSAAPILMDLTSDFYTDAAGANIQVVTSETVYTTCALDSVAETIFSSMYVETAADVFSSDVTTYLEGAVYYDDDYNKTYSVYGLPKAMIDAFLGWEVEGCDFDAEMDVHDSEGSALAYYGTPFEFSMWSQSYADTIITDFDSDVVENDTVDIDVIFSNYLSDEAVQTLKSNFSSLIIDESFTDNNLLMSETTTVHNLLSYDIGMIMHLSFSGGTLQAGDYFTIDLSSLYDIYGGSLTSDLSGITDTTLTLKYNGSTFFVPTAP